MNFAQKLQIIPRCGVLLVLLPAPAAYAQVTAVSGMTESGFNAADCDNDDLMTVTFNYTGGSALQRQYSIFGANASSSADTTVCTNEPNSDDELIENQTMTTAQVAIPADLTEDQQFTVADFIAPACDDSSYRGTRFLCMRITENASAFGQGGGVPFTVDTQIPDAATSYKWQAGDKAISLVSVTRPSNTVATESLNYVVYMRPCSGGVMEVEDAGLISDVVASDVMEDALVGDATLEDASVEDASGEDAALEDAAIEDVLVADTAMPDVFALDSYLKDSVVVDSAAFDTYAADVSGEDAGEGACGATGSFKKMAESVQLPITVSGLVNKKSYEVRLRVRDGAGNFGPASGSVVLTPRPEFGFWDLYQGAEEGAGCTSCASVSGSKSIAVLLLLGCAGWIWRRRRAKAVAGLMVLALVGSVSTARADFGDVGVHLNLGPYKPNIDQESGANGVYSCIFDNKTWVMGMGGFDVSLFDLIGTLSVGAELGYFTVNGHERLSIVDGECGKAGSSLNTLHMMPLSANLHYRFDWPYKAFQFPLAPYWRLGLNATPWVITRNGQLEDTGGPISGLRTGWQWAMGVAFVLDVVDEARMRRVRETGTFQHAYLFAEWREMKIDSFGEPGFQLGNSTWFMGISIDF